MVRGIFRGKARPQSAARLRFDFDRTPRLIYAIGDVHGCMDELLALEAQILADAGVLGLRPMIILLGDLVDRGPESRAVLEHVLGRQNGGAFWLALSGNHDDLMLRFVKDPVANVGWLDFGGRETLFSYGFRYAEFSHRALSKGLTARLLAERVPAAHIAFLETMPVLCQFPDLVFAHAGLDPDKSSQAQTDRDLMWKRHPWQEDGPSGTRCVVQGHIADIAPKISKKRLILDTGCYTSGHLTAGRFRDGRFDRLFST